jgi:PAS domain S-box-containing protein
MLDPQGCVVNWNSGAERLKGYSAREIIGKHFSCFYAREQADRGVPQSELRVAADAGRFEDEGWRLRKDGSEFWANVVITAVRDRQEVLIGFTKVTRDLTERRRAEEQVRHRTAELSRTLREREVLLQEVHHRVKNNLQVISSLINMQARTLEGGAGRDALDECQGRIQAIALIHEKLYQSQDYANIPFSEYARALAENVFYAIGASS